MKRNDLISKLKRPVLYSAFPVALFIAYGSMSTDTRVPEPVINPDGMLVDTLPEDTTSDPLTEDTTGYPAEATPTDTATFPTEDNFPADTAGDAFPADTNGFNP